MAADDCELSYSQFIVADHLCTAPSQDAKTPTSPTNKTNKYYSTIKPNEKRRILATIVRLLLHRAPFTTRSDEIRTIVKSYIHDQTNHLVVNCFIEDAKALIGRTLGLTLCDVKTTGGKRELFLKQSLAFRPHDVKINSEGDHELRGFLLLMLPCLKTYTEGVSLDRLCDVFKRIGKGHMIPKTESEADALMSALRSTRRRKDVKYRASDFKNIADYLLYARDLGYLTFTHDPTKGESLAMMSVHADFRFNVEINPEAYLEQFNTLEINATMKRRLNVFLEG
ncbi:uncharacterized protein BXIN_0752 [Babesia sp. Xinjiang]|uniref:uncharacterized protein n=1 Tax=Babesia sp. Xinjiang TaxID=462227 RepID=UPI000A22AE3B|nr:uncharacterized protein BXIN_0752 [Babesia sp. Xinjiang]ORM41367.1 hypothetical protein BXIN_0752 [Babesia sp. Xinjiang]